jgi:hypothetical protein
MEELMDYFPREIALQIMQYTYQVQDKTLLGDIVNFTKSKARLYFLYLTYFTMRELYFLYLTYFTMREESDEYESWLSNDIVLYMNNFRHTGVLYGGGYVDKFYTRLSRNPFLNTREKIDRYVVNLGINGVDGITKEIRIYLGLLTSEEREEFIEWVIKCYGELFQGGVFLSLIN